MNLVDLRHLRIVMGVLEGTHIIFPQHIWQNLPLELIGVQVKPKEDENTSQILLDKNEGSKSSMV